MSGLTRIKPEDFCWQDIEWYAVDREGNVGVFCSGGCANVPRFAAFDSERTERLIGLFSLLPRITQTKLCFVPCPKNPRRTECAEDFSCKGLYYYDSDDASHSEKNIASLQEYYTIQSVPVSPIKVWQLTEEIQELLKDNRLNGYDFTKSKRIDVVHAYP